MGQQTVEAFERKVADFIQAHGLFADRQPVLLAVSGGADSVALLAVMKALTGSGIVPSPLVCIHINHKLRGADSDGDEHFVTQLAAEMGVPCIAEGHDVSAYATEHKLSTETAGRQLRMRRFADIARIHQCAWIATGHQKNDNAETLVHRLRRGTGFRGLAGIVPMRLFEDQLWLARPLLACTRAEIVAYLRSRNLPWRDDQTNTDCKYTRNYVRHRLLPYLQNQSGAPLADELSALARSAQRLRRRVSEQARREAARHIVEESGTISINAEVLVRLPEIVAVEFLRRQLIEAGCGERDVTQCHYASLLELARSASADGGLTLPKGIQAYVERGRIVLRPTVSTATSTPDPVAVAIPGQTTFAGRTIEARVLTRSEMAALDVRRDRAPNIEYLDLDRVGRPLVVRWRRPGDRFVPLGSSGQKKVGKFLTTAKVPKATRENVLVFASKDHIVWVCPIRIGEHAKVHGNTQHVLMLIVSA